MYGVTVYRTDQQSLRKGTRATLLTAATRQRKNKKKIKDAHTIQRLVMQRIIIS